jgi:betaine-aldehyde dehydrogenase
MVDTYLNYIGGEWVECEGRKIFDSYSPSSGELVARAQNSGVTEAQRAIESALKAFDDGPWRSTSGKERAAILYRFADLIEDNEEMLGTLIGREMGKPIRTTMEREVRAAVDRVRFYAGAARMIRGEVTESAPAHLLNIVRKEPVGVCALILPWNDPVELPIRKLGAALAAGCTVVIKAASDCAASTMALFKLIDQIKELPKGVVNAITGKGSVVGEYLAKSPLVDKVSFTGSTETGRRIMELASGNMKKVSLECGGKAPFVLFDDANLDKALDAVKYASFAYAGQSCSAITRLIIQRRIHKTFLEKLIAACKTIKLGDPADSDTMIGPMVSETQMNKALDYIEIGKREGAKLVYGGYRIEDGDLAKGYYVCPTIFDEVSSSMTIAQEEIFGPVLCVMPFEDEQEAIEIANSTPNGLQSAIWSSDTNRCLRMVSAIEAGDVWVNTYYIRMSESPYGGIKESGLGTELGLQGIEEYLVNKRICFDTTPEFHTRY